MYTQLDIAMCIFLGICTILALGICMVGVIWFICDVDNDDRMFNED